MRDSSKRFFASITLCALLGSANGFAATLDQWGTIAANGSYSCAATCDLIDFIGQTIVDSDGMSGQLSASSSIAAGDPNGSAQASATVVGGLAVPELKAEAYSTGNGGVTALAAGVQGYTYTGGSGTVSLSINLTGSINDTTAPPPPLDPALLTLLGITQAEVPDLTRLEAIGALFSPNDFSLDQLTSLTPLGALDALSTYTEIDSVLLVEDSTNNNIQNLNNIISIGGLAPGDTFYLFTALLASADGAGQYADSFSTLSVDFVAGGGEVSPAAVPIAPAWALLLGPIVMLGRNRRIRTLV